MVRFTILGPIQALDGERPLAVGGPRQLALLALLLVNANQAVSSDALIDALWPDVDRERAAKRLQMAIARLRKALEPLTPAANEHPIVRTVSGGYLFALEPGHLDADAFQAQLEAGQHALRTGDPARAAEQLRQALDLWRGPPLAEVAFHDFAQAEVRRLDEQRLTALEARLDADLQLGRHTQLIPELETLAARHPAREQLAAHLMLALYRSGRQADALQAYHRTRAGLAEQLGLEPGPTLRALQTDVLAQSASLEFACRGGGPGETVSRIPRPATRTVGREPDITALLELLLQPDTRLATVTGPGGVGKTRLAIELARRLEGHFGDGAHIVSLAPVDLHVDVASTIAHELGGAVLDSEPVDAALVRHLRGRELLLVVDNFEHVLAAGPLVAELLAEAPGLTVLATSREPLRLRGERVFRLDPLGLSPEANARHDPAPAIALFTAVATARDHRFVLTERDMPVVADICRRLDGLPLAIELAAGRVGLFSVTELGDRLRRGFDVLGPAARDAPDRQRTLNAALDWSYQLLSAAEQAAVRAVSVFAGGCTLDAAREVTASSVETIEALVDKSMLMTQPASETPPRVAMLQTVREFAHEQLARGPDGHDVRLRHLKYFLALAEEAEPEIRRTGSPALRATMTRELHNLRTAMSWALDQGAAAHALRLATALQTYWEQSGEDGEAARWLAAGLQLPGDSVPTRVRAAALASHADALAYANTAEAAEAAARESLELWRSARDPVGCAQALNALAHVLLSAHHHDLAFRHASEAERLARDAGARQPRVEALEMLAGTATTQTEAERFGEGAAAIHRATGNRRRLAFVLSNLIYGALIKGDDAAAQRPVHEAVDAATAFGDPLTLGHTYGNAGIAALLTGSPDAAAKDFATELEVAGRLGYHKLRWEALEGLAAVAAAQGRDESAARLLGAAHAASLERHHPIVARRLDDQFFAPSRRRLGESTWQTAYAAGQPLGPDPRRLSAESDHHTHQPSST
jgi:predicted ATPase/DNA-binding SARP family transcriptional activator